MRLDDASRHLPFCKKRTSTPTSRHLSRLSCSFSLMPTTCQQQGGICRHLLSLPKQNCTWRPKGVMPYLGTWTCTHQASGTGGNKQKPQHLLWWTATTVLALWPPTTSHHSDTGAVEGKEYLRVHLFGSSLQPRHIMSLAARGLQMVQPRQLLWRRAWETRRPSSPHRCRAPRLKWEPSPLSDSA